MAKYYVMPTCGCCWIGGRCVLQVCPGEGCGGAVGRELGGPGSQAPLDSLPPLLSMFPLPVASLLHGRPEGGREGGREGEGGRGRERGSQEGTVRREGGDKDTGTTGTIMYLLLVLLVLLKP